jgi:hypothetical protein
MYRKIKGAASFCCVKCLSVRSQNGISDKEKGTKDANKWINDDDLVSECSCFRRVDDPHSS